MVQRPRFTLPPEVSRLTGGEFQSMVRSSTQAPGPPIAWLVMFHADWCSASVNIQPMFGALARRLVLLPYKTSYTSYIRRIACLSHLFWTSSSLDVPARVTQEEGHTGFLIHLPSAMHAFIFLARRIQPFLSLVDREVEFVY